MTVETLPSPFKGLAPFQDTELDALLFFGREREREIVLANLLASRLTVLYGASGVGKTSLLRAAVAHSLRAVPDSTVERTRQLNYWLTAGQNMYLVLRIR